MMIDNANDDYNSNGNSDEDGSHVSHPDHDVGFVRGVSDATKVAPNYVMSTSEKIARREARFVSFLRLGLFLVLLAASIIASALVYWRLAATEQADFEEAFSDYRSKLTDEFQRLADRCLGTIAAFSNSITANAVATNAIWPFVVVPNFESQVRHTVELANIDSLVLALIVEGNERKEWEEEFIPQNLNKWVKQSMMNKQSVDDANANETLRSYQMNAMVVNGTEVIPGYSPSILATELSPNDGTLLVGVSTSAGPYMPVWQTAPLIPGRDEGYINVDLNTDSTFDGNIISILNQQKAALGRYTIQGYGENSNGNPTSGFYYPVLRDLPRNSTVGGAIATLILWLPFFSNVLPQSAVGMIGVLGNSCNQSFTFRVDGATATFVGDNDLHDRKYDHLKQEVSFLSLITDSFDSKEYLGFPIDDTGCKYTLNIYPSYDLQKKFVTNTPIVASIVILLIFIVTSLLFVLYDRLVERRQRLVQKEAESSGAIVSSLFPAAYRERLMAAQVTSSSTANGNPKESMLNNISSSGDDKLDQPIADLYPECTVLFADIVGFTNWSATRQPVNVFWLLQEVYATMDKVAKKFRIFKVETIGDCYMAVTGLPNPQSNHAQLMSRFATECLIEMRETVTRLMGKLGKDTADLTLRIGLHSGPVTAGILRGVKSRFQLFGDTVNTASRMESTGAKSRIQVSNATADILRQAGKGHWLQQREDLVEVKGKGTMQTYWLSTDRTQSTVSKLSTAMKYNGGENKTDKDTQSIVYRTSIGELYDV